LYLRLNQQLLLLLLLLLLQEHIVLSSALLFRVEGERAVVVVVSVPSVQIPQLRLRRYKTRYPQTKRLVVVVVVVIIAALLLVVTTIDGDVTRSGGCR